MCNMLWILDTFLLWLWWVYCNFFQNTISSNKTDDNMFILRPSFHRVQTTWVGLVLLKNTFNVNYNKGKCSCINVYRCVTSLFHAYNCPPVLKDSSLSDTKYVRWQTYCVWCGRTVSFNAKRMFHEFGPDSAHFQKHLIFFNQNTPRLRHLCFSYLWRQTNLS